MTATELAGEPITARLTEAPGNGAAIGGLKVTTENGWFAARPSGTEDVYKIYAESFLGPDHLAPDPGRGPRRGLGGAGVLRGRRVPRAAEAGARFAAARFATPGSPRPDRARMPERPWNATARGGNMRV